ncbi:MAG: Mur ligase family protein, partial [Halanaerobiaceae bacterium]
FNQVINKGHSIINSDDRFWKQVRDASRGKVITYAIENNADLQVEKINLAPGSVSFRVKNDVNFEINLNLSGRFNVYNSLAAIGTALSLDISPEIIKAGLEGIEGVAGRFELIREGQNFTVVVDYAHTPDGMENVLKTAAELRPENIISVFGCGGDRDRGKRPQMGKIAVEYSNYSILTSDNPRSENPGDIIAEIEKGIDEKYVDKYEIISDRRDAIFYAVNQAQEDDIIIIFGKGHETYQVFSDKTIHFDDREVARKALQKRMKNRS